MTHTNTVHALYALWMTILVIRLKRGENTDSFLYYLDLRKVCMFHLSWVSFYMEDLRGGDEDNNMENSKRFKWACYDFSESENKSTTQSDMGRNYTDECWVMFPADLAFPVRHVTFYSEDCQLITIQENINEKTTKTASQHNRWSQLLISLLRQRIKVCPRKTL